MRFSPEPQQFIEMSCGNAQDAPDVAAFCRAGPNGIEPVRQPNLSLCSAEAHNDFGLRIKSMDVGRLMILWIGDKSYSFEPERAHAPSILRGT
jgi:hypothetical protein